MKFFHDLFTGKDNTTYDIGRFLWFQGCQAYLLFSGYALYKGGTFDPITWGGGLAALLGAGGAALGLKAQTESDPVKVFERLERQRRARRMDDSCDQGGDDDSDADSDDDNIKTDTEATTKSTTIVTK